MEASNNENGGIKYTEEILQFVAAVCCTSDRIIAYNGFVTATSGLIGSGTRLASNGITRDMRAIGVVGGVQTTQIGVATIVCCYQQRKKGE